MTPEQIAALCLALPGAREDIKWGGVRVFSIAGNKMFALLDLSGSASLAFKVDDDLFLGYCDRPGFRPAPYLARAHWVSLSLSLPEPVPMNCTACCAARTSWWWRACPSTAVSPCSSIQRKATNADRPTYLSKCCTYKSYVYRICKIKLNQENCTQIRRRSFCDERCCAVAGQRLFPVQGRSSEVGNETDGFCCFAAWCWPVAASVSVDDYATEKPVLDLHPLL